MIVMQLNYATTLSFCQVLLTKNYYLATWCDVLFAARRSCTVPLSD